MRSPAFKSLDAALFLATAVFGLIAATVVMVQDWDVTASGYVGIALGAYANARISWGEARR